jgi:hypothetical protein
MYADIYDTDIQTQISSATQTNITMSIDVYDIRFI